MGRAHGIIPARAGFTWPQPCRSTPDRDHPRSRGVYDERDLTRALAQGSSPLARGLQPNVVYIVSKAGIIPARAGFTEDTQAHARRLWDHPRSRGVYHSDFVTINTLLRIIPARAGFTAEPVRRARSRSDHPRSRGVYTRSPCACPAGRGSSPLARGLPVGGEGPLLFCGIIPARAGFTTPEGEKVTQIMDHPRSRGVYDGRAIGGPDEVGSSPLARGLRAPVIGRVPEVRIIPARAGFTEDTQAHARRLWDHPRSRGVYRRKRTGRGTIPGSSPLARGLPARSTRGDQRAPGSSPLARGLPGARRARPPPPADHPRSRGVYRDLGLPVGLYHGSSPLARGLQARRLLLGAGRGIIPARAGFTAVRPGGGVPAGDHPRSRGVYGRRPAAGPGGGGSSPLARGLHAEPRDLHGRGRIIPARAGFTRRSCRSRGRRPDHPRSRGVYNAFQVRSPSMPGSSPLARGLPGGPRMAGGTLGIIPARAGFTCRYAPAPQRGWDHPRSRGVYGAPRYPGASGRGSSPLARGLPHHWWRPAAMAGIIPARAGFTPVGSARRRSERDHPRSRGVYPTAWCAARRP